MLLMLGAVIFSGCATTVTLNGLLNEKRLNKSEMCGDENAYQYRHSPPSLIYSSSYIDFHEAILAPWTKWDSGDAAMITHSPLILIFYPPVLVAGLIDLPISLATDTLFLPYTIPKQYLMCRDYRKEEDSKDKK